MPRPPLGLLGLRASVTWLMNRRSAEWPGLVTGHHRSGQADRPLSLCEGSHGARPRGTSERGVGGPSCALRPRSAFAGLQSLQVAFHSRPQLRGVLGPFGTSLKAAPGVEGPRPDAVRGGRPQLGRNGDSDRASPGRQGEPVLGRRGVRGNADPTEGKCAGQRCVGASEEVEKAAGMKGRHVPSRCPPFQGRGSGIASLVFSPRSSVLAESGVKAAFHDERWARWPHKGSTFPRGKSAPRAWRGLSPFTQRGEDTLPGVSPK